MSKKIKHRTKSKEELEAEKKAAAPAAQALGVKVGFIGEAANSVGGYLAGLPTAALPEVARKKQLVLLNVEPQLELSRFGAQLRQLSVPSRLTRKNSTTQ